MLHPLLFNYFIKNEKHTPKQWNGITAGSHSTQKNQSRSIGSALFAPKSGQFKKNYEFFHNKIPVNRPEKIRAWCELEMNQIPRTHRLQRFCV